MHSVREWRAKLIIYYSLWFESLNMNGRHLSSLRSPLVLNRRQLTESGLEKVESSQVFARPETNSNFNSRRLNNNYPSAEWSRFFAIPSCHWDSKSATRNPNDTGSGDETQVRHSLVPVAPSLIGRPIQLGESESPHSRLLCVVANRTRRSESRIRTHNSAQLLGVHLA